MVQMKDYYEILELERNVEQNAIKRAYFRLIRIYSPEKDPEHFKSIKAAYETLYNPKKREEYDKRYDINDTYIKDLNVVFHLTEQLKYKEALILLKELSIKFPDEYEIEKQLGILYLNTRSFGNAIKVLEKLCKNNPTDRDGMKLLAEAYGMRGFANKAHNQYKATLTIYPLDEEIWYKYMTFMINKREEDIYEQILEAEKIKKYMFEEHFLIYLSGLTELFEIMNFYNDFGGQSDEEPKKIYTLFKKFTYCFTNSKTKLSKEEYSFIVSILSNVATIPACYKDMTKIMPLIEKYPLRTEKDEKMLKLIYSNLKLMLLLEDPNIPDVLKAIIEILISECDCQECKEERIECELYILDNISILKKNIVHMQKEYNELFELNKEFFINALKPNMVNNMIDKRVKTLKKLKNVKNTSTSINQDDAFNEFMKLARNYMKKPKSNKFKTDQSKYNQLELDIENMKIREAEKKSLKELDEDVYNNSFFDYYDQELEKPYVRDSVKIGRNDPCPCGSGRKYKQCCGK